MATSTPPARDQRDLLRTIAEGTAGTGGAPFLRSLSRCLAPPFAAPVPHVAPLSAGDPPARGRILACWPGGDVLPEGFEYELADTPCERIADAEIISHPTGSVARFPRDGFLARHALEGYLAVPMRDTSGAL